MSAIGRPFILTPPFEVGSLGRLFCHIFLVQGEPGSQIFTRHSVPGPFGGNPRFATVTCWLPVARRASAGAGALFAIYDSEIPLLLPRTSPTGSSVSGVGWITRSQREQRWHPSMRDAIAAPAGISLSTPHRSHSIQLGWSWRAGAGSRNRGRKQSTGTGRGTAGDGEPVTVANRVRQRDRGRNRRGVSMPGSPLNEKI